MDEMDKYHALMLRTIGWYAHIVGDDPYTPFKFNYHTHGLYKSFGHLDLQVVMPLHPKTIHLMMIDIIAEIRNGKKFETGIDYPDLVGKNNYMVRFIDAIECDRPVLRLLIPDKNGRYEGEFAKQFEMLDNSF